MSITLVNPMDERALPKAIPAPRLRSIEGACIALLDIGKAGGSVFLDRLRTLLHQKYGVLEVLRYRKPTFAKPIPESVLADIRQVQPHAVIEALAD